MGMQYVVMAAAMEHPDHGNITKRELNTRHHDGEETFYCERCHTHVPRDEPERFDEIDCDHYKSVAEGISGTINGQDFA